MFPIHLSLALAFGIGAAVLLTGCGSEPAVNPPATIKPEAQSTTEVLLAPVAPTTPPPAPPVADPGQIVSTIETKDSAYTLEMAQTLNDFLGDYIREKRRIPKDINEMVSLKIITSVPVLPGGKKWVINQQTGKISAQ